MVVERVTMRQCRARGCFRHQAGAFFFLTNPAVQLQVLQYRPSAALQLQVSAATRFGPRSALTIVRR